ncbi:MAG: hypothetical protein RIQ60_988 [Pseudomonadota bacterium]|jgi:signal transduction histidine kinase
MSDASPTTPPATAGGAARWLGRLRHSLRMRLVALFVVLGLAMSAVFAVGMQNAFSGGWRELVRPLLHDYVDRLIADLGSPPDAARAQALAERLPVWLRVRGPVSNFDTRGEDAPAADDEDGRPRSHADERPPLHPLSGPADPGPPFNHGHRAVPDRAGDPPPTAEGPPPLPHHGGPGAHRRHMRDARGPGPWLLTRTSADGHVLQVGLEVMDFERRPRAIGWATLGALLLLTLGAYAYVRHLLRPLAEIGAGAQRFGRGDFATPITLRRQDELGELAAQVNTMARDIHAMLDAKRALLLAISHELRSPLTRARLNAELVDEGPARDALLHDLAAMRDLITDLLESERLAAGHSALQCEAVDPAALLRSLVAEQFGGRDIRLDLADDLGALALDPPRLRLAVRNLISNALRHGTPSGGTPRVDLQLQRQDAVPPGMAPARPDPSTALAQPGLLLSVRDHGTGVAPEQLGRLGQAFWRADNARQRSTGGVGLGLYLVRLVAEAHGGHLRFADAAPGLRAELWLPLAAPRPPVSAHAAPPG